MTLSKEIGLAKVIDESAFSDGSTAQEILNFRRNERGNLETKFLIMPMIHPGAAAADVPAEFSTGAGCLAICYATAYGEVPEILFLTDSGVFQYAPWRLLLGHLEEQLFYGFGDNVSEQVVPQGKPYFPPQWAAIGNRIYFTFCDGGGAWVWDIDNTRLRPFGYTARPGTPDAQGPAVDDSQNDGGFSHRGRIGTTDGSWTDIAGNIVGGVDDGEWHYYAAFENTDGAYSAMSARGGMVSMRLELAEVFADPESTQPEDLARRWRVYGIPQGPAGTQATILLRTRNLKRLPAGDSGEPRFLHRIQSSIVDQWIDDIPDGELGPVWDEREVTPTGFYLLRAFSGSLFFGRTAGFPCRVWWSEQTNVNGPTPESVLAGHWRDVYPQTGPITALFEAQVGGGAVSSALLVLKENACHFVTGNYPDWQYGTLHQRAGCAGPNVIASVPDGSVIWYGARTFWRLSPNGVVEDIGSRFIRKRLRRINYAEAKMGTCFVDRHSCEVIFSLPIDDSLVPNFQFVWDYIAQGWRTLNQMTMTCALEVPTEDLIFVAGIYDEEQNVFVWDRGSAGLVGTHGSALYRGTEDAVWQSGWCTIDKAPKHTFYQFDYMVGVGDELYDGALTVRALRNWNSSEGLNEESEHVASANDRGFTLAHPEQPQKYWRALAVSTTPNGALFSTAASPTYYRERRPYTVQVGTNADGAEVIGVELTVSPPNAFALVGLSVYGEKVADNGTRVGRVAEAS